MPLESYRCLCNLTRFLWPSLLCANRYNNTLSRWGRYSRNLSLIIALWRWCNSVDISESWPLAFTGALYCNNRASGVRVSSLTSEAIVLNWKKTYYFLLDILFKFFIKHFIYQNKIPLRLKTWPRGSNMYNTKSYSVKRKWQAIKNKYMSLNRILVWM